MGAPLRGARAAEPETRARAELADLEAAKEAKYREIRDAELDHRTGKLSQEDFCALDGELRAEAVALLQRIDAVRAALPAQSAKIALMLACTRSSACSKSSSRSS